jgi:hypothetical protein
MDYSKYKNDGWGLSELALKQIADLIENKIDTNVVKVVEFGSGISTRFLVDLDSESKKDIIITSFDNDPAYAYKGGGVTLHMRKLMECTDKAYDLMFENKEYDRVYMKPKSSPLTTRQKNNFYDIQEGDLGGEYDLMILDGPNGNGRNISYLHMKEHLKSGGYVLIDDFTHYDFVDRLLTIFEAELIFEHNDRANGGEFVIYKIN